MGVFLLAKHTLSIDYFQVVRMFLVFSFFMDFFPTYQFV